MVHDTILCSSSSILHSAALKTWKTWWSSEKIVNRSQNRNLVELFVFSCMVLVEGIIDSDFFFGNSNRFSAQKSRPIWMQCILSMRTLYYLPRAHFVTFYCRLPKFWPFTVVLAASFVSVVRHRISWVSWHLLNVGTLFGATSKMICKCRRARARVSVCLHLTVA